VLARVDLCAGTCRRRDSAGGRDSAQGRGVMRSGEGAGVEGDVDMRMWTYDVKTKDFDPIILLILSSLLPSVKLLPLI